MSERAGFVAGAPLRRDTRKVEGALVELDGERFYRIANHDAMPPFFMSLVSDSDHWLFASSNGALTAGRRDPDRALFPYYTDDRIHDSQDQTGAKTLLRVARGGARLALGALLAAPRGALPRRARPLQERRRQRAHCSRRRTTTSSCVFRYAWTTSERFGFVRSAALLNTGAAPVEIEVLDGVQNLLPYGIDAPLPDGVQHARGRLQGSGARRGDRPRDLPPQLGPDRQGRAERGAAGHHRLVARPGARDPAALLDTARPLPARRRRRAGDERPRTARGLLRAGAAWRWRRAASKDWLLVCDVEQDACAVRATLANAREGRGAAVRGPGRRRARHAQPGADRGERRRAAGDRRRAVGRAPLLERALQRDARRRPRPRLRDLARRPRVLPAQGQPPRRRAPGGLRLRRCRRRCRTAGCSPSRASRATPTSSGSRTSTCRSPSAAGTATRAGPGTCSRSRSRTSTGEKILNYQGNWRDIFQNWEALALSFPGYVESMIFKFLDASTADGYNPYRITRDGFDWEVVDPHDPWSHIGYWGDHQVIYLLKLLEVSRRYHPGALEELLASPRLHLRQRALPDQALRRSCSRIRATRSTSTGTRTARRCVASPSWAATAALLAGRRGRPLSREPGREAAGRWCSRSSSTSSPRPASG